MAVHGPALPLAPNLRLQQAMPLLSVDSSQSRRLDFARYDDPAYLNLLLRGNPFGARRPASARLPRQSASSLSVSEKARPAPSAQVSPSAPLKVFTSDSP